MREPRMMGGQEALRPDRSRLVGAVRAVNELTSGEREEMYALLSRYFSNVGRAQFERDLAEKEWAVVLRQEKSGQMQGFSTVLRLRMIVDGEPIMAFYSGDTIIDRDHWGQAELPRVWLPHVFRLAESTPDVVSYWFLACCGYKTYRFLPVFSRVFYPTYDRPTPAKIKRRLDALALKKFGADYDPATGVVRFAEATPLRTGVAEITSHRLDDPHVAFFVSANPGHLHGHGLACVAELDASQLTTAGRRLLGR